MIEIRINGNDIGLARTKTAIAYDQLACRLRHFINANLVRQ